MNCYSDPGSENSPYGSKEYTNSSNLKFFPHKIEVKKYIYIFMLIPEPNNGKKRNYTGKY